MKTEIRQLQPRADAVSRPAQPYLALRERLAIATFVTVFNVWIGVAEVIQRRQETR